MRALIISCGSIGSRRARLLAEMEHFLACAREGNETCNPLRSAAHVLEWAIKAQEQIRMVTA